MRIALDAKNLPGKWYNIVPDLGFGLARPSGSSGYALGYHDLEPLAPGDIITQELENKEREVPIPAELRDLYTEWRPTPLFRAERLERRLQTPAMIFYKYEGGGPSGSYELNTALAQALYASRDRDEGVRCLVTATGSGEWGASLAIACNCFDIKCKVYMVRSSYEAGVHGRHMMEVLGAEVVPSPSESTQAGKKALSQDPGSPGSLGLALSESYEEAAGRRDAKFAWGTVMNHVLLHQSLIGLEAREQMKRSDAWPDICVASVGGGSGFGGLVFPFWRGHKEGTRFIAVESAAAPSLTKGRYAWDYADSEKLAPMLKMYTLGHSFVPPTIRAGGMRYHGISPIISALYREELIEAKVHTQRQAFEAGILFARSEGFVPSPEASYAIKAVVDEALACRARNERKVILFLLSTNSNFDIDTFKDFQEGAIEDRFASEAQIEEATRGLRDATQG